MKHPAALLFWGILLLCSCKSPEYIVEKGKPYQRNDVAGAWFGFAQADLYLYRLHLSSSNGGTLAYSSPFFETPRTMRIQSWQVQSPNAVRVELVSNPHLKGIDGRLVTSGVFIGVLNGSDGWSNAITLYREEPFETRLQRLKQEMR